MIYNRVKLPTKTFTKMEVVFSTHNGIYECGLLKHERDDLHTLKFNAILPRNPEKYQNSSIKACEGMKQCRKCKKQGQYQSVSRSVTNLATTRKDTVNEEPFLGTIDIISTHSKGNQWIVELLLNGKPVQFKIDTGADINAISEEIF